MPTSELPDIADAYLKWAYEADFSHFRRALDGAIGLLVRFEEPIRVQARTWLAEQGLRISPWYDGYRHATVSLVPNDLPKQLQLLMDQGVSSIKFASPTAPPFFDLQYIRPRRNGPQTVLGVIDDGCPFGHRHFRPTDPTSLAVRFIWNQVPVNPTGPMPVPYGESYMAPQLKALLDAAKHPSGVIEESTLYRLSRLPSLQGAMSHGAQVMSHASGQARHRHRPVSLGVNVRSDIAFVQLPPKALDDPSGQWLDGYALDGIHAIRFYARKMFKPAAQRVIINLSYGPQTGPHDGTSVMETAMDEIIQQAQTDQYEIQIVVPSGNSHLARAHAEFDLSRQGGEVDWCVSPDCQVPSSLEVWLPQGTSLNNLDIALTSPAGDEFKTDVQPSSMASVKASQNVVKMIVVQTARPRDSTWASPPLLAVPGRWKVRVKVSSGTVNGLAHAYLARIDPNLGRRSLGHSGYLDSPLYDCGRYLRPSAQLVAEPPEAAEVVARGSMSGIATGTHAKVAAGYVDSKDHKKDTPSPYSSGGPSRGARIGPDYAYPTDESVVLNGVLGDGNRSATVLRLIGTSTAAPQFARDLLQPASALQASPPSLPDWFKERFGGGRLA